MKPSLEKCGVSKKINNSLYVIYFSSSECESDESRLARTFRE